LILNILFKFVVVYDTRLLILIWTKLRLQKVIL